MPAQQLSDDLVRQYKAVQNLISSLNACSTTDEILQYLLEQCFTLTKCDLISVFVPDLSGLFVLKSYLSSSTESLSVTSVKPGEDAVGRTFLDGLPRISNNTALDPDYIPLSKEFGSQMVLPLSEGGKVFSVLRLDAERKNFFSDSDFQLYTSACSYAGQLLQQIQLKRALELRIRQKDILIDISQNVAKHFDINEVFSTVMHLLAENFDILRGMLVLFDNDTPDKLSVHAAFNLTPEEMSRGIYKVGEGIIGRVVASGEAIAISDIFKEKDFLNRMKIKRKADIPTSFIAVPFRSEGEIEGVIAVEKRFESFEILNDEKEFMTLVSSLILTKIKVYQRISGEQNRLLEENSSLKQELKKHFSGSLITKNKTMLQLLDLVQLVSDSNSSILILGESGTGKELIAREIHRLSHRAELPFITVNCAAIPENLLESELFGYKKGAFTGAVNDKKGKFQLAHGGTLFLDEIGDMPLLLQVKLLRAIQEKEIEPVGSEKKEKVDIRILAATNKDLSKLIAQKLFREDLFYRLNVVELKLPPLRDRLDDIPFLASFFIEKFTKENNRKAISLGPSALRILQSYYWPGNVRELENVIERAVLLCRETVIDPSHLPQGIADSQESYSNSHISSYLSNIIKGGCESGTVWNEVMGHIERELIQLSLLHNNRNKVRTAEFLGINRNTLSSKIENYGIE